jgi:hypothetical protein
MDANVLVPNANNAVLAVLVRTRVIKKPGRPKAVQEELVPDVETTEDE